MSKIKFNLLIEFNISDEYTIYVYKGIKSDCDILIKHKDLRIKVNSRKRALKHSHIFVDLLFKKRGNKIQADKLLDYLIEQYGLIYAINSDYEFNKLNENMLLSGFDSKKINKDVLSKYGDYSVDFMVCYIKLLIMQEKTNYPDEKLFIKQLNNIKTGNPTIWSVISKGSYRGS